MSGLRRRPLLLVLGFGLGLGVHACVLANPSHCFNLAVDTNAWCKAVNPDKPFCSPCQHSDNDWGCVADEPTDCPSYTAPASESGTGTDSGTGTGTDSGTGSTG